MFDRTKCRRELQNSICCLMANKHRTMGINLVMDNLINWIAIIILTFLKFIFRRGLKRADVSFACPRILKLSVSQRSNRRSTSSAIISAIAKDDVAAGDGALRTCSILFPSAPWPSSKIKSSTNLPSASKA